MSNSSLVSYTKLSPNNSGKRTGTISRITPHCVVGQCSVETLGALFAQSSRQASSNYGIGVDGRVALYVPEDSRAWTSSSSANDNIAVTIECASDTYAPYAFKDVVYQSLIDLCVDICKRNGKNKLLWLGTKDKTLAYTPKSNEMVLSVHRWFANKSCPGEWLMERMSDLAEKTTAKLSGNNTSTGDNNSNNGSGGSSGSTSNGGNSTTNTNTTTNVKVSLPMLEYGVGMTTPSSAVKKLQILLNGLGYSCGSVDGGFGSKTMKAVKEFQQKSGLSADGVVGAKTWAALCS